MLEENPYNKEDKMDEIYLDLNWKAGFY